MGRPSLNICSTEVVSHCSSRPWFPGELGELGSRAYLGKPSEGPSSAKDCNDSICCDLESCPPVLEGMTEGVSVKSNANRIPGSNDDESFECMPVIAEGSMSMMDNAGPISLIAAQR